MEAQIHRIEAKKLVGIRLTMSFAANTTGLLWSRFMPRRHEVMHRVNSELISMQIYPNDHDFNRFNPASSFEKWAGAEVSSFDDVPAGMETIVIPAGLYVMFRYKGSEEGAMQAFNYIFGEWFPASAYVPDHRPHFEALGSKYKKGDPASEEEIWIPVMPK